MKVMSNAFILNDKYSYSNNISIPVEFSNLPESTKSLVLIFHDLDPGANDWIHWFVINIPKDTKELIEGASHTNVMPKNSIQLVNSFGEIGYGGPCPPQTDLAHEYRLSIFAMDIEKLEIEQGCSVQLGYKDFKELFKQNIIEEQNISTYYKNK